MAIFAGGWEFGRNEAWRITGGAGLITVLTLITAVILAISGRYPQRIFDLVLELNRWCYRVLAHVALMRDEYPPSQLGTGGTDPGHLSPLPADRPRRSRPPQAAARDQHAPAGAPVSCPFPGKPFAEPGNESWLRSPSKRAGLRLLRSPDRWCPFWLWLVWARWAWDLWLYRLLRTAVPGWVMRRIGECMDAFGRDGTPTTGPGF